MVINNYLEQDKIILVGWVDKTLDQMLTKKNIIFEFRFIGFWPFNPKVMEGKTNFNILYTSINMSREEEDDTISNNNNEIMLWEEYFVVAE